MRVFQFALQVWYLSVHEAEAPPTPAPDDRTIVLGADGYDITHLSPFARWKRENYLADVRRGVYRRHPQHDDQPLQ